MNTCTLRFACLVLSVFAVTVIGDPSTGASAAEAERRLDSIPVLDTTKPDCPPFRFRFFMDSGTGASMLTTVQYNDAGSHRMIVADPFDGLPMIIAEEDTVYIYDVINLRILKLNHCTGDFDGGEGKEEGTLTFSPGVRTGVQPKSLVDLATIAKMNRAGVRVGDSAQDMKTIVTRSARGNEASFKFAGESVFPAEVHLYRGDLKGGSLFASFTEFYSGERSELPKRLDPLALKIDVTIVEADIEPNDWDTVERYLNAGLQGAMLRLFARDPDAAEKYARNFPDVDWQELRKQAPAFSRGWRSALKAQEFPIDAVKAAR